MSLRPVETASRAVLCRSLPRCNAVNSNALCGVGKNASTDTWKCFFRFMFRKLVVSSTALVVIYIIFVVEHTVTACMAVRHLLRSISITKGETGKGLFAEMFAAQNAWNSQAFVAAAISVCVCEDHASAAAWTDFTPIVSFTPKGVASCNAGHQRVRFQR